MQRRLIRVANDGVSAREPPLTGKRRSIVRLIIEGKTSKEIAEMLHMDWRRVEQIRRDLMHEFEVPNAVALAAYAIRHRLLPLSSDSSEGAVGPITPEPARRPARKATKGRQSRKGESRSQPPT